MFIRYYSTFKAIRGDYEGRPADLPKTDIPPNDWIYGPTRTGKSFAARKENPDHYLKPLNKWWDRIKGTESVIIEDIGTSHAKWIGDMLKIWADRYSFPAEIKGGVRFIRPARIIVTSNYTIRELFPDPNTYLPLEERFVVRNFTKKYSADAPLLTNEALRPKLVRTQPRMWRANPYILDEDVYGNTF